MASTAVKEKAHTFSPGDNVEVAEGELVNLRGKVQSVDGDKVVMLPVHEDLKVRFSSLFTYSHTDCVPGVDN